MEVDNLEPAIHSMRQGLQKEGFLGPVTALFWDSQEQVLLAGRGCDILIQNIDRVFLGSLRPFQNGRVHVLKSRVQSGSSKQRKLVIAAASEKRVTVSEVEFSDESCKSLNRTATVGKLPLLGDWVLDLQMLRSEGPICQSSDSSWEMLAVGLAHNTVEIWNWQKVTQLRSVRCEENPLLCSFAFWGDEEDSLTVACGGFTREVLCWKVGTSPSRIVRRLRGHTGVIHCVKWRADGKVLISASEDRCVRVWEIQDGRRDDLVPPLKQSHVLWGHAARIWDCRIWKDIVVSSSEDGTGRVYRLGVGDADEQSTEQPVEELALLKGHQGKHVWKCEVCSVGGKWKVATGGNDAAIKVWVGEWGREGQGSKGGSEHGLEVESYAAPTVWAAGEDMEDAGGEGVLDREEFVRCCRMVEEGRRVVCGTNQGRCAVLDASSGQWECVLRDGRCQFTAVDVDPERGVVVLGDARGGLSVASLEIGGRGGWGTGRLAAHDGHVMDVYLRHDAVSGAPVWYTGDNAETAEGGAVRRWAVREADGQLVSLAVIRCRTRCRVTSLMECEWEGRGVVICGDRKGTLSVTVLRQEGDENASGAGTGLQSEGLAAAVATESDCFPCSQVSKGHRANSVTSVCQHTDGRIYSTGRDGAVCIWRLESMPGPGVQLVKEASVKGWGGLELIAGVAWDVQGRMLVAGFQHVHFVLADVAERKLLASVDCGGARRPYGYLFASNSHHPKSGSSSQVAADPRALRLAFVRDMKLHLAAGPAAGPLRGTGNAAALPPTSSPAATSSAAGAAAGDGGAVWFHGRELHQVVVREAGDMVEALTVSEDGSMKVVRQQRAGGGGGSGRGEWEIECVETLEGDRHVQLGAALRCVASMPTSRHGEVLVAGGAKDVIHCWARSGSEDEGSMAVGAKEECDRRWKLLSTVRIPIGKGVMARLLAMHAIGGGRLSGGKGEFIAVVAAADDGLGRVLAFHLDCREWRLCCVMAYHKVAILSVSGFTFKGRQLVVTGAADGNVAVWDSTPWLSTMKGMFGDTEDGGGVRGGEKRLEASLLTGQRSIMAPIQTWFRHGGGINALEVVSSEPANEFWMVTGSDDQQLKVMKIHVEMSEVGNAVQVIECAPSLPIPPATWCGDFTNWPRRDGL